MDRSIDEGMSEYVGRVEKRLDRDVRIFDTTLRDGEQTPGAALSLNEKLEIAKILDDVGVDVIEAGFPAVSKGELNTVREIGKEVGCEAIGLARTKKEDIDAVIDAGLNSCHTFIGTSKLHREYKLRMSKEEIKEKVREAVSYIKEHGMVCEFSCEDATRTELPYLKEVYRAAVEAGADRINVPDTVGVMTPRAMSYLIGELRKVVDVPISVHCHNDFGLAVANSLAGIEAGASQVHCTVNGIGERAGNASMEQVAVSLYKFYGKKTIELSKISWLSEVVEKYSGIPVAINAPVVGRNAFSHESGIHVHGIMKKALTYEPYSPSLVGARRAIILGKHSGSHAIRRILEEEGMEANDEEVGEILQRVKYTREKGEVIGDKEVISIAREVLGIEKKDGITMEEFVVTTSDGAIPIAAVTLNINGRRVTTSGVGVGPIDAITEAIRKAVEELPELKLSKYRIDAIGTGTKTIGEVFIKLESKEGDVYFGRGASKDIVKASTDAFIDAYNKALKKKQRS
ncbi:MAG: 2-isopropylmalate synthase [Methanobacteriota archaeon]|nr:MAG: 2-isopropylmalate synthase [Euryarchaeota archaeon]